VQTIVARSCLPVGPMFEITKSIRNEVIEMKVLSYDTYDAVVDCYDNDHDDVSV
jgi:hypothetical protein